MWGLANTDGLLVVWVQKWAAGRAVPTTKTCLIIYPGTARQPSQEYLNLRAERREHDREAFFERAHALRIQHEAVHVAENVSKPKKLSERVRKRRVDHRGTNPGNRDAHVRYQLPVPLVALRNAAVELLGDAYEHAFDAVVEVVQNGPARPQREDRVVPRRSGVLIANLVETVELVPDLRRQP